MIRQSTIDESIDFFFCLQFLHLLFYCFVFVLLSWDFHWKNVHRNKQEPNLKIRRKKRHGKYSFDKNCKLTTMRQKIIWLDERMHDLINTWKNERISHYKRMREAAEDDDEKNKYKITKRKRRKKCKTIIKTEANEKKERMKERKREKTQARIVCCRRLWVASSSYESDNDVWWEWE